MAAASAARHDGTARTPPRPRHGRDQRHALCRRDAGAADRLHGDGAAADGRRAGGSAQDARAGAGPGPRAAFGHHRQATARSICRSSRSPEDELVPKLTAISNNGYDQRIFVRGDTTVDYGRVMEVMGMLSRGGLHPYRACDGCRSAKARRAIRGPPTAAAGAPRPTTAQRSPCRAGDLAAAAWRADRGHAGHLEPRGRDAAGNPCRAGGSGTLAEQTNVARRGAAPAASRRPSRRRPPMDEPPPAARLPTPSPRRCRRCRRSRSSAQDQPRPARHAQDQETAGRRMLDAVLNKILRPGQAAEERQGGAAHHPGGAGNQSLATADLADALRSQIYRCWNPAGRRAQRQRSGGGFRSVAQSRRNGRGAATIDLGTRPRRWAIPIPAPRPRRPAGRSINARPTSCPPTVIVSGARSIRSGSIPRQMMGQ